MSEQKKYETIAIDGPSGSGKGTTAGGVAKKLGWLHLDAGSFYRAIAFHMYYVKDISPTSVTIEDLKKVRISFSDEGIILNGKEVEEFLRTTLIDNIVAEYAQIILIREHVQRILKDTLKQYSCVIEGRVTTSIVAPDAKYKFYLTCSVEVRAARRAKQRKITDPDEIAQLRQDLAQRDYQDMNRDVEPLIQVSDAILVETDDMEISEQIELICSYVK